MNYLRESIKQQNALDTYVETERKRGSINTWTTKVYEIIPNKITEMWNSCNRFIVTQKEVFHKGKFTFSTAFRITDICDLSAKKMANGIRGHWGIENRLHWVRDVILKQDSNRIKNDNAAVNMAFFNTLAINYLRENLEDSILYSQILFGQSVKEQYRKMRT